MGASEQGEGRVTSYLLLMPYTLHHISPLNKRRQGGVRGASARLTEKLEKSSDFRTYKEIQQWLAQELGLKVSYDVVHYLVHDKLNISLKKGKKNHNHFSSLFLTKMIVL